MKDLPVPTKVSLDNEENSELLYLEVLALSSNAASDLP